MKITIDISDDFFLLAEFIYNNQDKARKAGMNFYENANSIDDVVVNIIKEMALNDDSVCDSIGGLMDTFKDEIIQTHPEVIGNDDYIYFGF